MRIPINKFNMYLIKLFLSKIIDNPKNGDKIKLTFVKNPRNAPTQKSTYIGSIGIVEDMDDKGNFVLVMETALLVCHGGNYLWRKLAN